MTSSRATDEKRSASVEPAPEKTLFVEGAAGKLRVSDGGSGGTPVVFVHGLASSLEAWRAQLDHLRSSRRAVAFDQRGHGASEMPRDGDFSMPALAFDVEAVVRALQIDKFFLVGHSMSGLVLTAYAAKHADKVAGVVYVDAVGDVHEATPELRAHFENFEPGFGPVQLRARFDVMLGSQARPETRARVLDTAERTPPAAFIALRKNMLLYAAGADASRYAGPRLAVQTPELTVRWSAATLVPGIQLTTLENVSHWLMMDDPETFNRTLDEFIGIHSR